MNYLKYKASKQLSDFQKVKAIGFFGDSICSGKITRIRAVAKQSNLLNNILEFNDKAKPKWTESKKKKLDKYESVKVFYEGRKLTLNAFESRISPLKQLKRKGHPSDFSLLKIITPKQMIQRIRIAFTKVKAGSTSENLLSEMCHIIYSLYKQKNLLKNFAKYHEFKLQNRMDTIFINSENSKISNLRRLLLNFSDKIDLDRFR